MKEGYSCIINIAKFLFFNNLYMSVTGAVETMSTDITF